MSKIVLKPAKELIPLMLENKRKMQEECKNAINRPEVQNALKELKKLNNK